MKYVIKFNTLMENFASSSGKHVNIAKSTKSFILKGEKGF